MTIESRGSECLDAEVLAAFADGRLKRSEIPAVLAHLRGCRRCMSELEVANELAGANATRPFRWWWAAAAAVIAAIFVAVPLLRREEPPIAPTWIGLAAGIIVGATVPVLSLVLGLVTWWLVYRVLKRMMRKRPKIKGTQFIVSPAEIRSPDGSVVPVGEVKEVVWRDWAIGRSDNGFGVYVERKRGAALTIAKDMDGAGAHRLANEIAGVLDVPATEGLARQFTEPHRPTPSISIGDASVSPAVSQGGGFATFAASEGKATPAVSQAIVHRADGPQPGDVLLKETGVGEFVLQRVTRAGFEHWQDVPHSGLIDAMMFAHATVGDRNLWLEKMVDAGQPTLIPKLSQS